MNDQVSSAIIDVASIVDRIAPTPIVNVRGRVLLQGFEETMPKSGKTLRKQETIFTDNTPSVHAVLWEGFIEKIQSGSHYTISMAVVKEYEDSKYLTVSRKSEIKEYTTTVQLKDEANLH